MPETARVAVLTDQKRLALRACAFPTIGLDAPLGYIAACGSCQHSFDVAEAERAMQTLAGAFPEEQALPIAIVPRQGIR
jgi:hypothetical protein